jgi:hypothetical protein
MTTAESLVAGWVLLALLLIVLAVLIAYGRRRRQRSPD